jgi:hypothetical protein
VSLIRLFISLTITLALCASMACGSGRQITIESTHRLSPGEFALGYQDKKNTQAAGYSEQLTFTGRFADKGRLHARLFITNMAGGNGRAELNIRLTTPQGETKSYKVTRKKGSWSYTRGEFDVLVGKNRIRFVQGEAQLTLRGPGIEADLNITSNLPAFRPSGECTQFGEGYYYQTTVLFPRGQIKGVVRLTTEEKSDEEMEVEGTVFAEHRQGNIALYTMSRRWIQVKDIGSERTFVLSAFQRAQRLGSRVHAWMYVATDDSFLVYEPTLDVSLEGQSVDEKNGYSIPKSLSFRSENGSVGAVKSDRLVSAKSDLQSLHPLVKSLVSVFMDPWTYRYDIRYLIRPDPLSDKTYTGVGSYSYMQLH